MIADAAPSSSIVACVTWIEQALLGTVATAVAVICIAGLGYAHLAGRLPTRRGVTVVIGCFILFGAPNIAAGLRALAARESPSPVIDREPPAPQFVVTPRTWSKTGPDPFNPYAGE